MTPTNEAGHGLPEPCAPWRPIEELDASDDLFWFLGQWDGKTWTVDGPRAPQAGGYDADEWDYFCYAAAPPTELPVALSRGVPEGIRGTVESVGICGMATIAVDYTYYGPHILSKGDTFTLINDKAKAAPAAAGAQGEDEIDRAARRMGDSARSLLQDIAEQAAPQPAAADVGVRERARELFDAMLAAPYGSTTMGDIVCAETTCNRLESAWLPILEAALSSHRQAGDVAGLWPSIPSIQRWKMERGSDGHRWSVYMDHCELGEWCKWEEVQQAWFCQALALVEKGAG